MAVVPRTKSIERFLCSLVLTLTVSTLTASGQQLTSSSVRVDFGNVQIGTSSQGVTLTNRGTASLTISAYSVSGTGFSLTGLSLPKTLNGGDTTTFTVTFAPTAAGAASGSLTITSNTPTLTVPLSGICITQGSLLATPGSVAFGQVKGSTSSLAVTLTNNGGTSVTILGDSISGSGFRLNGLTVPQVVNPGSSTSFNVDVTSAEIDTGNGSLVITSDGSNPSLVIPLSASAKQKQLEPSPAHLLFGDADFQTKRNLRQTLTNNTERKVTISAITVSGRGFSLDTKSLPSLPLTVGTREGEYRPQ